MALVLGIGFSVIGIDSVSGTERFTMGVPELFDGVSLVTVTVAMLALGEVFFIASRSAARSTTIRSTHRVAPSSPARSSVRRCPRGCAAPRSASHSA
ncbi:tripartite tricarboxylate transporter permease [Brevibacterium aurantiacum]|uniref:tripartite tricarboxylate transporter permease n=1 Tax=Brevibacterium aurantiacum TaxID=273384 RepID=UPI003B846536